MVHCIRQQPSLDQPFAIFATASLAKLRADAATDIASKRRVTTV
jgi:hypothetical protein